MILLDFSKGFNKVPHKRLLYKINYYGIRHSTNQWIVNFLEGRTQQVLVEGVKSTTAPVHSGVPQGSVLRPLLFLLYINDLPDAVSEGSTTRLFADDCALHRDIKTTEDARKLQDDLEQLVFCFVQKIFFRTTQELEYLFFLSREAHIFFPEFNIRLYDKNSESDYFFFLHQNQNIFFSNIGNQNIFLEKNHNPPPPPLQVKWSFP